MKKIFLFLSMVALSVCPQKVMAEELVHVADKAGNMVSFLVADHPTVSFDDENIIITTDAAKVYYPLSSYYKFSVETAATGITAEQMDGPSFSLAAGLSAEGLQPGTAVMVFSASGQKLAQGKADSEGKVALDVNASKGTVCIVKAGTASFKFIK